MKIRSYEKGDMEGVVALWIACGLTAPQNNPVKDIQRKMKKDPGLFFVGEMDGVLVAVVMAGYDGHRGWINYLGVDPKYQRLGLGEKIMTHAEAALRELGCAKINLQVRTSNTIAVKFYEAIGFMEDDVRSFGKKLDPDN